MVLRRFMGLRGTPTRFQSDRGEQLVAAARQVSTWDFKEVIQWAGKKGIEWTLGCSDFYIFLYFHGFSPIGS
jgi:hypothetical protein